MEVGTVIAFINAAAALVGQFQWLWPKIEEIIQQIKGDFSTDDQAAIEAELAALRARMPQIKADTEAALDAAAKETS